MKKNIAIFDLDGTLMHGNVWKVFIQYLKSNGIKKNAVRGFEIRNYSRYLLYRAGVMPKPYVWDLFARNMVGLFHGFTTEAMDDIIENIFRESIAPRLDGTLLERWEAFGEQGILRVIVSGSPQPVVARVGKHLNATAALGTIAERRNGHYTGKVDGRPCQEGEKARRLQEFIAEEEYTVDWKASYSFADDDGDFPILKLVGNPVAVRPNARLYARARAEGWTVLGEVRGK